MFKLVAIIALAFYIRGSAAQNCEQFISGSFGSIVSPGYPGDYGNNLDCYYHVTTTTYTVIALNIAELTLENGPDYLNIYDGPTEDDHLLGSFTGTHKNAYVNSSTNEVLIYFHTDSSTVYSGFNIYFNALDIVKPECPADSYSEESGVILSPGYPDVYPNFADCYYSISASERITFRINHIDVELDDTCEVDYVQIYDGPTNTSSSLGKLCGSGPIHEILSTSTKGVLVHFHSDGYKENKGFNISYSTEPCESTNEYSGDFGTFSSPGYPLVKYPIYSSCKYAITTPYPSKVLLHVNYLYLEYYNGGPCIDRVSVYDGPSTASTILAEWCGSEGPFDDVQGSTNEMLVLFSSDYSGQYPGFSITYTAVYPY